MKREKRLWHIDPTKECTEKGKKEKSRQRPYWKEFYRLEKNMEELAESYFCTYKQLSEEDKVWLEKASSLSTGTRIIRVRDIPDWCYGQVLQYRIEKREAQNKARREKYARKKEEISEP